MPSHLTQPPPPPSLPLRPGNLAIVFLGLGCLAFCGTWVHAMLEREPAAQRRMVTQELARELRLTGFALSTETRYTRHPELTDRHTPFQNHPGALEHFPSGTWLPPPRHWHD